MYTIMEVDLSSIMVGSPMADEEPEQDYDVDEKPNEPEKPKKSDKKSDKDPEKEESADPEEEERERRQLATQIRQCLEEFPEKLATLKGTKPENLSLTELKKIWSEIEYMMGAKQNLKMAVGAAIMTIKAVEDLTAQFTPLKIQGLHQVCNDPDVLDDLKFICIKSTGKMTTTPEQRFGMRLLTTAFMLHGVNSSCARAQAQQPQVIPETDPKFADL